MAGLIWENNKGQFEPVQTISQGQWCLSCKFFEEFGDLTPGEQCLECGCAGHNHVKVKVVTHDDS